MSTYVVIFSFSFFLSFLVFPSLFFSFSFLSSFSFLFLSFLPFLLTFLIEGSLINKLVLFLIVSNLLILKEILILLLIFSSSFLSSINKPLAFFNNKFFLLLTLSFSFSLFLKVNLKLRG